MKVNLKRRYVRSPQPGVVRTYEPGEQDMPDEDAIAALTGGYGEKVSRKDPAPENKLVSAPEGKATRKRSARKSKKG